MHACLHICECDRIWNIQTKSFIILMTKNKSYTSKKVFDYIIKEFKYLAYIYIYILNILISYNFILIL